MHFELKMHVCTESNNHLLFNSRFDNRHTRNFWFTLCSTNLTFLVFITLINMKRKVSTHLYHCALYAQFFVIILNRCNLFYAA